MSFPMPDLLPAYAEIFLVAMASVILISDLVIPGRDRGITYGLSLLTLLGCAVLTVGAVQGTGDRSPTPSATCSYRISWATC